MTYAVEFNGNPGTVTVGFDALGQPKEVFASGPKEGTDKAHLLADACVIISLALQHGATPEGLAKSLGTVPTFIGNGPASDIGRIMAIVAEAVA